MTTKNDVNHQTDNEGDGNKYFHIMLNIADDDLDVYEYRLLGHYIRICGVYGHGACWESTKTTAKQTKMSTGKVSSTRNALSDKGYIRVIKADDHDISHTLLIKVLDRWLDNMTRYQTKLDENGENQWQKEQSSKNAKSVATNTNAPQSGEEPNAVLNVNTFSMLMQQLPAPIVDSLKSDTVARTKLVNNAKSPDMLSTILSPLVKAAELEYITFNGFVVSATGIVTALKRSPDEQQRSPGETIKNQLKRDKDSLPQKNAEDVAPDAPISDAKQKGDDTPNVDWQAKILALLGESWLSARTIEDMLEIPLNSIDPLEFSKHPAAIALYALEAERQVEYMPNYGRDSKRRAWRLHPDGGPAPKSEFDVTADETKELKPAIPEKVVDSSKLTKAQRDAWYDAVHEVFQESGGLNGKYQKLLRGEFKDKKDGDWFEYQLSPNSGLTPDLLCQWGSQYRRDKPDIDIVKQPIKVQSKLLTFLAAQKKPAEPTYAAPYHRPHVVEEVILSEEEQAKALAIVLENDPFKNKKVSGL